MNSARARLASVAMLSLVALVALAAPAAAATPVVADNQFKWFYWIGLILAVSMVLWLLVTLAGYYVRVIRPKHRGRETS